MVLTSINPSTGETLREFRTLTESEIDAGIGAAQSAFVALRSTTFSQRSEWMRRTADVLESDIDQVASIMTAEMGKPIEQARSEAAKCVQGMRFYADHAERFLTDQELVGAERVGASRAWTMYEPLGPILAVMPWNFPMWQAIRFAAPALMSGNTGVLKHASNVPQTALYLDTLFERGGFPRGSFRALLIGSGDVERVLRDHRVHAVTLTGSESAGRAVAAIAGSEVKKAVLELGGSDPFIVMPSADLATASEVAVRARVQNNGQSCVAAKRFLVHADVYDEFAARFAQKMTELRVGDPSDACTDVGPLATESGRRELAGLVDDAVSKGATVLAGGRSLDGPGWFFEPTVLADLSDDMRVVLEETFGPVASLYRVADREEAIRIANQTTFGLSSSVWTTDAVEEASFIREISAGAVFINGMTASFPELPFGGIKNSGIGRELAAEGIREFMNLKTVWRA